MKKRLYAVAALAAFSLSAGASSAAPSLDVGFSPEGSAERLVLRTLDDARESIRLMGYSFTSPEVVRSLVAAKRRGVDVRVVVDDKGNRSQASRAAMNVVISAGIPLRTNGQYKIMHDKVIITDGQNVELRGAPRTPTLRTRWLSGAYRRLRRPIWRTGSHDGREDATRARTIEPAASFLSPGLRTGAPTPVTLWINIFADFSRL